MLRRHISKVKVIKITSDPTWILRLPHTVYFRYPGGGIPSPWFDWGKIAVIRVSSYPIVILPPVNIDTFRAGPNTSTSPVLARQSSSNVCLLTYIGIMYVYLDPGTNYKWSLIFLKLVSPLNYRCHKGLTRSISVHNRL